MIKRIVQGMVVGVANIIPGVSGGTMLVAMGLYDRLIYAVSHMRTECRKSLELIVPILLGAALAVVLLSRLFEYLLTEQPVPTNFGFCGLIIGSLPFIYKRIKSVSESEREAGSHIQSSIIFTKRNIAGIFAFAVFFILVIVMALLEEGNDAGVALTPSVGTGIVLIFIGIIAAATMVVPGVSGSMVLMLLGYYYPILHLINRFVESALTFKPAEAISCLTLLVPFGIGVLCGIVLIAKLIEWLLKHYAYASYMGILGLICSSPIAILLRMQWVNVHVITCLVSVIVFFAGLWIAGRFADE